MTPTIDDDRSSKAYLESDGQLSYGTSRLTDQFSSEDIILSSESTSKLGQDSEAQFSLSSFVLSSEGTHQSDRTSKGNLSQHQRVSSSLGFSDHISGGSERTSKAGLSSDGTSLGFSEGDLSSRAELESHQTSEGISEPDSNRTSKAGLVSSSSCSYPSSDRLSSEIQTYLLTYRHDIHNAKIIGIN